MNSNNTLILYEKYNREKLEKVIKCNNIPVNGDDLWKENLLKILKKYYKKPYENNYVKCEYTQFKKYGRFYVNNSCGIQAFQKDIRKYISGEYHLDIDFKNCHPVILKQLFHKKEVFINDNLDYYINNRDTFLKENNLSKEDIIKCLYDDNNGKISNEFLKDIHKSIYTKLLPVLIDKKLDPATFKLYNNNIKKRNKQKKDYNYDGSFLSLYIQDIENSLLMSLYSYCKDNNINVQTLMFDGLTIDKDSVFNISDAQKYIKDKTGYDIEIVLKPTTTNWSPEISKITSIKPPLSNSFLTYSVKENKRLYEACYDYNNDKDVGEKYEYDDDAINTLIDYLNNFVCIFDNPYGYGFRRDTSKRFKFMSLSDIKTNIRYGLEKTAPHYDNISWFDHDNKLIYDNVVFQVNNDNVKKNDYNLYIRPSMKKHRPDILNHIFFDYIKRVISSDDSRIYNYIINYISFMVNEGQTGQILVFMSKMGCGKSSFIDCLKYIIGEEYHTIINDISSLKNHFNAHLQNTILTQVEEVPYGAGEYNKLNQMLKTLATENDILITKKGIDSYKSKSNNNFILLSNEVNPINITRDNRRVFITTISDCEQNNTSYFKLLKQQVLNDVEELRDYFYNYEYVYNLNSIRPFTRDEEEIIEYHRCSIDIFFNGEMDDDEGVFKYDETNEGVNENNELNNVYNEYSMYCDNINKKKRSREYFTKNLKRYGYKTDRKQLNGVKNRYIIKDE